MRSFRLLAFTIHISSLWLLSFCHQHPVHSPPASLVPFNQSTISASEIADSDFIRNVKLSKDASQVVYCVGPQYKSGAHMTSSLWLASTSEIDSARQITFGNFSDVVPQFHPNGSHILFLSDRPKAGGPSHIYMLTLAGLEEGVIPITSVNDVGPVTSFSISPDGRYVTFISTNKPNEKDPADNQSDPKIWDTDKNFGRLHLIDLDEPNFPIRTLVSVNAHVHSMTWSPDSSHVLYRLQSDATIESFEFPVKEEAISLNGVIDSTFTHERMPGTGTVWTPSGALFYVQPISPTSLSSANALWSRRVSGASAPRHVSLGEIEDANSIVDVGLAAAVAVEVAAGLDSRIEIIHLNGTSRSVFKTKHEALTPGEWDIINLGGGRYAFAALRSSGVRGEVEDVWYGVLEEGKAGKLTTKLSSHNKWFAGRQGPLSEAFMWTAADGTVLQGIISFPHSVPLKKLPTVVFPHGGPYTRDIYDFRLGYQHPRPYLASAGYLVLSPNYRGSRGRGDVFARDIPLGTLDWTDLDSMIDAAVEHGIADPDRLAIAGLSQGGFLSAWGATVSKRFKAVVVISGVSDWGSLVLSSDEPDKEADLAGGAPWSPHAHYLRPSPIRHASNINVPILIMHGEEDRRVPVTQGIGLMRALRRVGGPGAQPQLILYPREPHLFTERDHAEDVLRRLLEHIDKHLEY